MKVKILAILFIVTLFTFVGCDKDSITEAVLGENSVTLSGDISKSYDARGIAGLSKEDSDSTFGIILTPKDSQTEMLTFVKQSSDLPAVGTYNVGSISTDTDLETKFIGIYSINNGASSYVMYSGSVNITKSSSAKVAGTFDASGYYFSGTSVDSTKILKVKGKFSTIPVDLD